MESCTGKGRPNAVCGSLWHGQACSVICLCKTSPGCTSKIIHFEMTSNYNFFFAWSYYTTVYCPKREKKLASRQHVISFPLLYCYLHNWIDSTSIKSIKIRICCINLSVRYTGITRQKHHVPYLHSVPHSSIINLFSLVIKWDIHILSRIL